VIIIYLVSKKHMFNFIYIRVTLITLATPISIMYNYSELKREGVIAHNCGGKGSSSNQLKTSNLGMYFHTFTKLQIHTTDIVLGVHGYCYLLL